MIFMMIDAWFWLGTYLTCIVLSWRRAADTGTLGMAPGGSGLKGWAEHPGDAKLS